MSDPAVDEQDHKATSVEPVEDVKDSGPVPGIQFSTDEIQKKLGVNVDEIETPFEILKKQLLGKNSIFDQEVRDLVIKAISTIEWKENYDSLLKIINDFKKKNNDENTTKELDRLLTELNIEYDKKVLYYSDIRLLVDSYISGLRNNKTEDDAKSIDLILQEHLENVNNFIKSDVAIKDSIDSLKFANSVAFRNANINKEMKASIAILELYRKSHSEFSDKNSDGTSILENQKYKKHIGGNRYVVWATDHSIIGKDMKINMPYLVLVSAKGTLTAYPITLDLEKRYKNERYNNGKKESYDNGILDYISVHTTGDGDVLIRLKREMFTKSKFVETYCLPNNKELVIHAVEALYNTDKDSNVELKKPLFYKHSFENEQYILFPKQQELVHETKTQQDIIDNLNIVEKTEDEWKSYIENVINAIKQVKPYEERYYNFLAVPGITIKNLLMTLFDYGDIRMNLNNIGRSQTGKSFSTRASIMACFGLKTGVNGFEYSDDAIESSYRNMSLSADTNLPIHIDEPKITAKVRRALKSPGKGLRGTRSLKNITYSKISTYIFDMNSEDDEDIFQEEEASQRRSIKRYWQNVQITDIETKQKGEDFIKNLFDNGGGYIYHRLKSLTVRELRERWKEIERNYKNDYQRLVNFGAFLLEQPLIEDIGETEKPDKHTELIRLADFFFKVLVPGGNAYQQQNFQGIARIDEKNGELVISAAAYDKYYREIGRYNHPKFDDFIKRYKDYLIPIKYHGELYEKGQVWIGSGSISAIKIDTKKVRDITVDAGKDEYQTDEVNQQQNNIKI